MFSILSFITDGLIGGPLGIVTGGLINQITIPVITTTIEDSKISLFPPLYRNALIDQEIEDENEIIILLSTIWSIIK